MATHNASPYIPDSVEVAAAVAAGAGINQLTGDVNAGPGTGSQAATIGANKVTLGMLATIAESRVIGGAVGAGTATPTALTPAQILTILGIPAVIADSTAGGNVTDLTVSGLTGNNKSWGIEGRVVTSNSVIANFTIEPNALATNQAAAREIIIGGGSEFNDSPTTLALTDNTGASGAGFIKFWGTLTQGNTDNWGYEVRCFQQDGAGNNVLVVTTGQWASTAAITSIRIHSSVASGIRTNSWLRVRQIYP
jgi:hypothetical protein